MSIISIFNPVFCNAGEVLAVLLQKYDCTVLTDDIVIKTASGLSKGSVKKFKQVFSNTDTAFNHFTHEKELSIAYLGQALSQLIENKNIVVSGYTSLLIPPDFPCLLKVCLTGTLSYRMKTARKKADLKKTDIDQIIAEHDLNRSEWRQRVDNVKECWDPAFYDLSISMDMSSSKRAAAEIIKAAGSVSLQYGLQTMQGIENFRLAASVRTALIKAGHLVGVTCRNGHATINIDKPVLMLNRLEEEIKSITSTVPGVKTAQLHIRGHQQPTGNLMPEQKNQGLKILLVDDEKEFVQTLSERLRMRQMDADTVHDGETALAYMEKIAPEVMVIDLKMPGIDGIEVLRQVKQTRPEIEVIVLTGHGSEQDKQTCLGLGAHAYLQKPVDIEKLSATIRTAFEYIKKNDSLSLSDPG